MCIDSKTYSFLFFGVFLCLSFCLCHVLIYHASLDVFVAMAMSIIYHLCIEIYMHFLQLYVYSVYIVLKILKKDDKENQCKYFGFV